MLDGFFRVYRNIEKAGIENPLLETLRLFDILSNGEVRRFDEKLLAESGIEFDELAAGRRQGVPLEHLIGYTTFMGLQFRCTPSTLIPRQETELLAQTALGFISSLNKASHRPLVVDMGTGSGNLAVSIAVHAPDIEVLATDVSPEAIAVAKTHVEQYRLKGRVSLFCGNMFEPLATAGFAGKIDVIVCNPPYLPTSTMANLAPEIINHEPAVAFDAGAYGIDIFRRLITDSPDFLKENGVLVFEIGEGQEKFVLRLLERSGKYKNIIEHKDDENKVRVMSAVKS